MCLDILSLDHDLQGPDHLLKVAQRTIAKFGSFQIVVYFDIFMKKFEWIGYFQSANLGEYFIILMFN